METELEFHEKSGNLTIIVSLDLAINGMRFMEDLLHGSSSFCLKSEMRKYWEQSLNGKYFRYLTFKIICIHCSDNNAYFMVDL